MTSAATPSDTLANALNRIRPDVRAMHSYVVQPSTGMLKMDAMENPFQAATEFGHATGQCSVCMRPLTNPESVKLGIGPVCRAKFGW